jgi:predicted cobalt transporter CbtA
MTTNENIAKEETHPHRVEALREAARIISGDRNKQYGSPEDNFERTAKIWSVILGVPITNEDVAMMMVGLKVARYASKSGFQGDTWVDIAGYAGCGYEVGYLENEKQ